MWICWVKKQQKSFLAQLRTYLISSLSATKRPFKSFCSITVSESAYFGDASWILYPPLRETKK